MPSRVGKKPILIPSGVAVSRDGRVIRVKGPKGEMLFPLGHGVEVTLDPKEVVVEQVGGGKQALAMHGTTARSWPTGPRRDAGLHQDARDHGDRLPGADGGQEADAAARASATPIEYEAPAGSPSRWRARPSFMSAATTRGWWARWRRTSAATGRRSRTRGRESSTRASTSAARRARPPAGRRRKAGLERTER